MKRLLKSKKGQSLVEYGLILGLIALVAFVAFRTLGGNVNTKVNALAGSIT